MALLTISLRKVFKGLIEFITKSQMAKVEQPKAEFILKLSPDLNLVLKIILQINKPLQRLAILKKIHKMMRIIKVIKMNPRLRKKKTHHSLGYLSKIHLRLRA